ncbi:MAG: glycosyltransferase family 92 protein [Cyanobium sp.]|nr:glycosyltransferase family 92 protein [Cyanobium sp.]
MFNALLQRLKIGRLGLHPPRPLPGRNGLAIVLVVRDEGRHIGEWARFHRLAGVRHVFVYDDGSTDDTLAELHRHLGPTGHTVIPWSQRLSDRNLARPIHNQVLAYAHAAANFGGAYRWLAFVDADEFLVPVQTGSLNEALAHLDPEVCNVSLPWHMFGRCGHSAAPTGGVVANYLQRAADPMKGVNFKCLVDPCRLDAVRVHSMTTGPGTLTWNDRGQAFPLQQRRQRTFYSADHLQLNHYYTRSAEELERKIGRGPNLDAKRQAYRRKVMRTVERIEADTVIDRRAVSFLERAQKR